MSQPDSSTPVDAETLRRLIALREEGAVSHAELLRQSGMSQQDFNDVLFALTGELPPDCPLARETRDVKAPAFTFSLKKQGK